DERHLPGGPDAPRHVGASLRPRPDLCRRTRAVPGSRNDFGAPPAMLSRRVEHGHRVRLRESRGGRRLIGALAIAVAAFVVIVIAARPDPFSSSHTYFAELDNVKGLGRIDRDIRI